MADRLGSSCSSRKRKQPDEDEMLLTEQPIENEYEYLDDDDEVDQEEGDKKKQADYEQMLRAQEPTTIDQYDDIKVTPFNLEEELEGGEFDKAGNYIFRKNEDSSDEDKWAESIDWSAIEKRAQEEQQKQSSSEQPTKTVADVTSNQKPVDKLSSYKQMLRIMKSGESVQKTIRRLGNAVPKRQFIKTKSNQPTQDSADIAEAKRKLDIIIELAHQRLEDGDMDIYQKSYEDLEEAIN